jgi:hypothetical protein
MDDEQFALFVRELRSTFKAAVTDAIEQGELADPREVKALNEALYGREDPVTGKRHGGLARDVRGISRKQNVQLVISTLLMAATPIAVAIIARG